MAWREAENRENIGKIEENWQNGSGEICGGVMAALAWRQSEENSLMASMKA